MDPPGSASSGSASSGSVLPSPGSDHSLIPSLVDRPHLHLIHRPLLRAPTASPPDPSPRAPHRCSLPRPPPGNAPHSPRSQALGSPALSSLPSNCRCPPPSLPALPAPPAVPPRQLTRTRIARLPLRSLSPSPLLTSTTTMYSVVCCSACRFRALHIRRILVVRRLPEHQLSRLRLHLKQRPVRSPRYPVLGNLVLLVLVYRLQLPHPRPVLHHLEPGPGW